MEAVCTDVVVLKDEGLHYFPDGYSQWERNQSELSQYNKNMLDAQSRKEEHLKKAIDHLKMRGREHGDDSASSAAKSKEKKLERAVMHRSLDGKKFKLFSLKSLNMDDLRQPQYVQAIRKNKLLHFKFPTPIFSSTITNSSSVSASTSPVIVIDRCSIAWGNQVPNIEEHVVLSGISLSLCMSSRIAVVGPNGQGNIFLNHNLKSHYLSTGKSTLITALQSENKSTLNNTNGKIYDPVTSLKKSKPEKINGGSKVCSISSGSSKGKISNEQLGAVSDIHYKNGLIIRGSFWVHHNLRVALISQHHIDSMSDYLLFSPVTFITNIITAHKTNHRLFIEIY
jgi:ATPase subunit of ABC transporter with duplicated ATPase domains